jgi:hypothetical protein
MASVLLHYITLRDFFCSITLKAGDQIKQDNATNRQRQLELQYRIATYMGRLGFENVNMLNEQGCTSHFLNEGADLLAKDASPTEQYLFALLGFWDHRNTIKQMSKQPESENILGILETFEGIFKTSNEQCAVTIPVETTRPVKREKRKTKIIEETVTVFGWLQNLLTCFS